VTIDFILLTSLFSLSFFVDRQYFLNCSSIFFGVFSPSSDDENLSTVVTQTVEINKNNHQHHTFEVINDMYGNSPGQSSSVNVRDCASKI